MTAAPSEHTPAYGEVDLTTCDREPIHVPGAIQPHGVLVAVAATGADLADARVVMISANSLDTLGVEPDEALGTDLASLLCPRTAETLEAHLRDTPHEPLVLEIDAYPGSSGSLRGHAIDVHVHVSGDRTVVELEPYDPVSAAQMTYQSARGAMARLAAEPTVEGVTAQLAREVRALLGFDRVMVYRFDHQWNGEVLAEEKLDELNPFLGLHYPATDIPAQARRLYTVNWTRLIVDIEYHPVPLHPVLDPGTGAPLDLSHSTLRSVSPIHIEYLSHMGVSASMSISLVIDEELWGLVACHHYTGAHRPPHEARAAAEFLAQYASQLIAERERASARDRAVESQRMLAELTARASGTPGDPIETLLADPYLLELVDATGAAVYRHGELITAGEVPPDDVLLRIAGALRSPRLGVDHSDRLQGLDASLAPYAENAAGALVIANTDDRWLVWLRAEQEKVVTWGGDPSNKLLAATEGAHVRLSPRRSFEKWREVVRGTSTRWTDLQVEAAEALNRHFSGLTLQHGREQLAMAESVQRSVVSRTPPTFAGLDVAARYLPASTFQLGGDWWDAFSLDDGRVAFVVGDVAGHGVSAATAMTQVRTALRAYLFSGSDAGSCLDLLDRLMDGLLDQRIATAIIAIVDPVTREVELASAGHPPPLLAGADSVVAVDVEPRPLLGLGEGTAVVSRLRCAPGDTLLLFTDGLVERRGVDLDDSVRLLRAAPRPDPGPGGLDAWADRLLAVVPGIRDDDTTVLAVRLNS